MFHFIIHSYETGWCSGDTCIWDEPGRISAETPAVFTEDFSVFWEPQTNAETGPWLRHHLSFRSPFEFIAAPSSSHLTLQLMFCQVKVKKAMLSLCALWKRVAAWRC